MRELEERAKTEFEDWVTFGNGTPNPPKELVAVGIVDSGGTDEVMWYELENVAEANADGRGEFYVDSLAIQGVLIAAARDHGYLQIGADTRRCIDAMLLEQVIVLWHTHTATTDPSREDIDEFPTWLADYGMVYHVPSGTTTVYNKSGIISSTKSLAEVSFATTEDARAPMYGGSDDDGM